MKSLQLSEQYLQTCIVVAILSYQGNVGNYNIEKKYLYNIIMVCGVERPEEDNRDEVLDYEGNCENECDN